MISERQHEKLRYWGYHEDRIINTSHEDKDVLHHPRRQSSYQPKRCFFHTVWFSTICCLKMFCFVTLFEYCLCKCQWDVQPLINILTYNLNVLIEVLNPGLKKLHVQSLVVPNGVIFLKPRPLVKWNNGKFTHASCFTFLMCSVHFTLSGMTLLDPAPTTSNNFVQFVFAKFPDSLPRESCMGPLASLADAIQPNSTHLDSGILISGNLLPRAGSSCMLFLVCV